ncbi:MAG: hypothetical protein Q8S33_26350 [Myxococcales bacterium]|nr:hypothetical protein [Myxococcales bacterium]MDP3503887.1 hypothetical protein [Myxococcales bacterium]
MTGTSALHERPFARTFDRLVNWFGGRHDQTPHQALQRRFLLGCALIALAEAVVASIASTVSGQPLHTWMTAGFGVLIVGCLGLLRRGVAVHAVVWTAIGSVALFFFFISITTARLHPEQLPWLVLLPLGSAIATRPERQKEAAFWEKPNVVIASLLAFVDGAAIVVAHHFGWTFEAVDVVSDWAALFDFATLLAAVSAMVWLLERELRRAEHENRLLRELLPMCAWCQKIRDERGGWVPVARYMQEQGAHVTHGICPTCSEEHFSTPE